MAEILAANEIEERCVHGQDAPCSCACPFPFHVREFLAKVKKGSFHAAFNLYREAVGFPELVMKLCPAPCKGACRGALELPIDMPGLERAALSYARSTEPVNYNLLKKQGRVAVVGAGLSGLSCARRLAVLHYDVTVYERQKEICGALEGILPREVFEPDIMKQFRYTDCQFITGREIEQAEALDFDAVYLSSGVALSDSGEQIFRSPSGLSLIDELVDGARAADEIEWFLKTGKRKPEGGQLNERGDLRRGRGEQDFVPYAKGEARREADRCTLCDCSVCMKECVLLRQYGQTPKDLSKDVGLALNVFPETQGRAGMREIGACNFCGLCGKICPSQIDIGAFLLRSRTELCQKGLLPKAHHEFWMRDMDFSDGEQAALFYQPSPGACKYLFFPGCQSGGSDPRYVTMTYEKLLVMEPETGLLLRCCGVPGLWAGETEIFKEALEKIREAWEQAGRPVLLTICPSCHRTFRDYLPDIPVKTVYELWQAGTGCCPVEEAAVFDPCASRNYPGMQAAVRRLAADSGVKVKELKYAGELAQCCSFGGHGYKVNPLVVKTQTREQAGLSPLPYITYCTNCRDIFASGGKACLHILDLIHGIDDGFRAPPTVTMRRDNRRALKQTLMRTYPTGLQPVKEREMLKLYMQPEVAKKLSDDWILEEDLAQVIETCEQKGHYLIDTETGHRVCHLAIGYTTYWVEYGPAEAGARTIHNAYSHRMTIKSEYGELRD